MSIVEVAKIAGLSHSTVSRVINNREGVAPETAKAVHLAMKQLGYTPPVKRRGRRPRDSHTPTTGTMALLMVGTDAMFARAPVTAAVFHSLEQSLTDHGYNLIVSQVGADCRIPPSVAEGHIDGLILHGYAPPAELRRQLQVHPSVWVLSQRSIQGYWGDRVAPDNEAIGRTAAEYLVSRGHRSVAYLHISATHIGFRARAECFVETAKELGAEAHLLTDDSLIQSPSWREEYAPEATEKIVRRLMDLPDPPTGVFVPRDRLTVRVYRALRSMGIEPGRDLEIATCDNEPILEALDPRPTTIDIQAKLIGKKAVEQLIWRCKNRDEPTRALISVHPELIVSSDLGHSHPAPTGSPRSGPSRDSFVS
ncbi:MAG: LacI family DNA-binding transcriptional regulator [Planctomycetota bacterium]